MKILNGTTIDFTYNLKLTFVSYSNVNEDPHPSDSNNYMTDPAICIRPTCNLQGIYKRLNPKKGRQTNRKKCTGLIIHIRVLYRWRPLPAETSKPFVFIFANVTVTHFKRNHSLVTMTESKECLYDYLYKNSEGL